MAWVVVGSDVFRTWFSELSERERKSVNRGVGLLQRLGPRLKYPYSSRVTTSRHANMRELRIQHAGRPYRVLYAFDPQRTAVLLVGGDKTGNDRWYEENVPDADRLYDMWLEDLRGRGLL